MDEIKIEKNAPREKVGRPPNTGTLDEVPDYTRAPMRADQHDEDPRERAKQRAKELMEHISEFDVVDAGKYYSPPEIIPAGWDYNWKRWSVLNQENPHYINSLRRTGWDFVPASRHPEYVALGSKEQIIIMDGMVLMERPKEISDYMKSADDERARRQVRQKEEQVSRATEGQFDRDNKGQSLVKIKKTYAPMPNIPE